MRKCISIIIIFVFLTLIPLNIFAEEMEYNNDDNECVDEYIIEIIEDVENTENTENTVRDVYACDSCRIPNLTAETQEQLMFFDTTEAKYIQENSAFLNTYAAYYFLKLKDHIPDNFRGSCSYVAATMLLSFYDTYWDGNIIDDIYEEKSEFNTNLSYTKSPSTKTNYDSDIISAAQEKYKNKTTFTDADYYEVLKDFSETDLQRKLIRIAVEKHIDGVFEYFSLFPHEVKSLLEEYLYEEIGFSSSEVYVELVLPIATNIKEYAIEKVRAGIPVFVSAAASLTDAHSFIIYDYDEANDELYCHMGWGSNRTHVAFSSIPYQVFEGAVTINFTQNSQHSHSNNYVDSAGNTYCSCYFSCHPAHQHSYQMVSDGGESKHIYNCSCSLEHSETVPHTYSHIDTGFDNHKKECKLCGYYIYEAHDFQYEATNSSTVHKETCSKCTYEWTSEHSYQCAGKIGTTHYESCSDCGYWHIGLTNGEFVQLDENNHSSACPVCLYSESTAEHRYDFRGYSSTHHEKYCIDCGYVHSRIRHSFSVDNAVGHYNRCLSCGAMIYVDGNDIFPIQSKPPKDPEEETE